jgi:prepilin-type N-terminal cleavage/methylation domain-containing protein
MTLNFIRKNIHTGGFTLVEILLAIFILGLAMATVYVSYSGTMRTSHQIEDESNIYKTARVTMDRMIKDLSSLQPSGGKFDFHSEKETFNKQEFHSLSFWSASHLAFGENEDTGRPATISYYVREDNGGERFSLWRSDITGAKPEDTKETEGGYVICKNIESFRLTFYDTEERESDVWDSSSISGQSAQIPASAKIELALVNINDKGKPYKFMTKVYFPYKKRK